MTLTINTLQRQSFEHSSLLLEDLVFAWACDYLFAQPVMLMRIITPESLWCCSGIFDSPKAELVLAVSSQPILTFRFSS